MSNEPLPGEWKEQLSVTFTATLTDYFLANYVLKHRFPATWIAYFLCGVVPLMLLAYELHSGLDRDEIWIPLLLLGGPILIVVVVPIVTWVKLAMALNNTPAAQGPQTYTFSDDGVCVGNDLARTEMKWATFLKVVETRGFYFLYIGPKVARFIPKRALPDPDERHELRQILRANLGDKAHLRGASG